MRFCLKKQAFAFNLERSVNFLLAAVATLFGTLITKRYVKDINLIGIDDANIFQVYARNIASGFGHVFYAGGERVEGTTSFLWTAVNSVLFAISSRSELLIFCLCFLLAITATFLVFSLAARLCELAGWPRQPSIGILFVLLCATPSFYLWSVWALMDVTLWVVCFLWFLTALVRLAAATTPTPRIDVSLLLGAVGLVLTRPEGVAVAGGLLVATSAFKGLATRSLAGQRPLQAAALSTIVAFALITGFRVAYFGFPFPNTFYAKVSADHLGTALSGLRYFSGFLRQTPWMLAGFLFWVLAGLWALTTLAHARVASWQLPIAALVVAAAILLISLIYVFLGGDHFAFFRFYQPIVPLCLISTALFIAHCAGHILPTVPLAVPLRIAALAVLVFAAIDEGAAYLRSEARYMSGEFRLAEYGRRYGDALTTLCRKRTPCTLATVPAGGIAFTFEGPVYDLLGLNLVEMAHRSAVKVGERNHASFEASVFWKLKPEIIYVGNYQPTETDAGRDWVIPLFVQKALKGLLQDARFQATYQPISFGPYEVIASRQWLDLNPHTEVTRLEWPHVTFAAN